MIELLGSNPVIKLLRSDRSFRLEVDLNFEDFDAFKDLPKYKLLKLTIEPADEDDSNTYKKPNRFTYFYKLLAQIAMIEKREPADMADEIKKLYKVESKKDLTDEQLNTIITNLEKRAGIRPPVG